MTFIAIIGDIKDSKELENRREVQQKLNTNEDNAVYGCPKAGRGQLCSLCTG